MANVLIAVSMFGMLLLGYYLGYGDGKLDVKSDCTFARLDALIKKLMRQQNELNPVGERPRGGSHSE